MTSKGCFSMIFDTVCRSFVSDPCTLQQKLAQRCRLFGDEMWQKGVSVGVVPLAPCHVELSEFRHWSDSFSQGFILADHIAFYIRAHEGERLELWAWNIGSHCCNETGNCRFVCSERVLSVLSEYPPTLNRFNDGRAAIMLAMAVGAWPSPRKAIIHLQVDLQELCRRLLDQILGKLWQPWPRRHHYCLRGSSASRSASLAIVPTLRFFALASVHHLEPLRDQGPSETLTSGHQSIPQLQQHPVGGPWRAMSKLWNKLRIDAKTRAKQENMSDHN